MWKLRKSLTNRNIDMKERRAILEKVNSLTNAPNSTMTLFPKVDKKRKRERAPSVFPPMVKKQRKKKKEWIKPSTLQVDLLQECLESSLDKSCWMFVLSLKQQDVCQYARELGIHERRFLQLFEEARLIWNCGECHGFDVDRNLSGYVQCNDCLLWMHSLCAKVDQQNSNDVARQKCSNCTSAPSDL